MIETVTSDLKVLRSKDKKPARVLVTGATGYVGGRLVRELVSHNYRVRVLVRDAHKLQDYPWRDQVEIVEGDALDPEALNIALQDIDLAYYMLHALMVSKNFEQMEEDLARNFGKLAKQNGVRRIVYSLKEPGEIVANSSRFFNPALYSSDFCVAHGLK